MADNYNIYKICVNCSGDGMIKNFEQKSNTERDEYETECSNCNGTGKYLWGEMREEESES